MRYMDYIILEKMFDCIAWLFASRREKRIIMYVPKYCRDCEVLGICRDENNRWKCKNGCWFIDKKSRKRR